jgi:hypothetical protein
MMNIRDVEDIRQKKIDIDKKDKKAAFLLS